MMFTTPDSTRTFDIPDEWWAFCEMRSFRPNGGGFYPYDTKCNSTIEVVPLESIEPPTRNKGVPTLKKYKLVPVLMAFQSPECALPPVQVVRSALPSKYQYQVHNGYHRFYASVAAGYSKLPITLVEPSAQSSVPTAC